MCGLGAGMFPSGNYDSKVYPDYVKEYVTLVLSILCFLVAVTSIQKAVDLMPVALALCVGGPGNLYACGGAVILASAFSISGIREFSGANLIPAI